ncbi:response regulator [Jannaschia formosa]|uniref:response regulator n=1 Tax=Jannaschia formosa TaxID=2259592 RepID=UPI000E1C1A65|nr:response regulator [Jannaschia formosa]TFL16718.1 response regulator [Jannaschia formosa]
MSVRKSLRILVVDDMSTSRGLLLQALDSLGIRNVSYATDGKDAIQKARTHPPHLVLSDLYMPEMNGLQLLQHLRHDPTTRRIGFILITGRSDEKVIRTGKSLGMNNFLPKPFTVADMKATIEAVVGRL